jgi:hypothetical protein
MPRTEHSVSSARASELEFGGAARSRRSARQATWQAWTVAATLRIADLRAAVARILEASERQFGSEIDLESLPYGYRRRLDLRETFDIGTDPGQPVLGDLYEDLEETLDLLGRPEDETFIWHDLSHVIGLLQLLAVLDLPPA